MTRLHLEDLKQEQDLDREAAKACTGGASLVTAAAPDATIQDPYAWSWTGSADPAGKIIKNRCETLVDTTAE